MNAIKLICAISMGLIMVGCDSRMDAVSEEMANIRNQQPIAIDPAPTPDQVLPYSYDAQQLRSPFLPKSRANELKIMSGKRVYPNPNRPKQELEEYPIEALNMKGSMRQPNGRIVALLQAPDGEVKQVQMGSYIGMNQGRIIAITPTRIDVMEIVPDGRDGFIERPRSLLLLGPAD